MGDKWVAPRPGASGTGTRTVIPRPGAPANPRPTVPRPGVVTDPKTANSKTAVPTDLLYWDRTTNYVGGEKPPAIEPVPAGYEFNASILQLKPTNGMGMFNPPAHYYTRSFNPSMLRATYPEVNTLGGDAAIQRGIKSYSSQITRNLGYFFQDPGTSGLTGGTEQNGNDNSNSKTANNRRAGRKRSQLWGFQFTYNPTSLNISTTAMSSVDFTAADPQTPMSSTSTISFQLWLNRLADLQELSPDAAHSKNYPRTITAEEASGICYRGTEYDLEFLWRTTNGDPYLNQPLLTFGAGAAHGRTADVGLLVSRPIWLNLGGEGSNMRYYGRITNVNVTHAMFTNTMVPYLTFVDVQFARIPTPNASMASSSANPNRN